jgi:muramoyltetrapeptide carboxypeptidase
VKALLPTGSRVGIVAPGFAARPDWVDAGMAWLAKRKLVPVPGKHLKVMDGYFAGPDEVRAADLNAAIRDASLDAIWFARGGYGTARLLDRIDLARLIKRPKVLVGYSDLTALFMPLLGKARTVCLHGPMITELSTKKAFHAPSLAAALDGRAQSRRIRQGEVMRPGKVAGRLMGGNLTVLVNLVGTPYMPSLRGAVLFLEELGEEAYRVDRLLQHLMMSKALAGVRGVIVGQFYVPKTARAFPGDRDIDAVLRDHLLPLNVPVVTGIPAGHGDGKWTLPLGGRASIDTRARLVTFDPRPV